LCFINELLKARHDPGRRLRGGHTAGGLGPRRALAPHGVSLLGLTPRFITAELTLADVNPQMADLKPLAAASLAAARSAIDALWSPAAVAA